MPVLGKRPNVFAAPQAKAYRPTMRDQVANVFSRALGDNYQSNELARGLFGSSGLGGGQGNLLGGLGLLDLSPLGLAFALNEGGYKMGQGNVRGGLADVAMAAVPIPAVAKGGKAVVRSAARRVAGKAAKAAPAPKPGFTAYHGSPHTFDQFDTAKIGTGEGAQAYGHGLYFAQAEDTARSYRDGLTQDIDDRVKNQAQSWMEHPNFGGDKDKVISALRAQAPTEKREDISRTMLMAADYLDGKWSPGKGSMYQVRINADPNDFLDWDRPLSQQSPKVQEVLGGIYDPTDTGERIVKSSASDARDVAIMRGDNANTTLPASQAAASRGLGGLGIPGIKYLDQGSRGAGEGSRNFVVFDPRIIDIMKRYGVAAPVAAAILAGTMQPPKGREPGA